MRTRLHHQHPEIDAIPGDIAPDAFDRAHAATKTPTLDKLANTAEPNRERLTWADPKPCKRWDGYTVTRSGDQPEGRAPECATPRALFTHQIG